MLHSSEAVSERTERSVFVSGMYVKKRRSKLTLVGQPVIDNDAQRHVDEVKEEVAVVVDSDAVVYPRAVTVPVSFITNKPRLGVLTDHASPHSVDTYGNACSSMACGSCT